MFSVISVALALGTLPAQTGALEIVNPRATYGHLGATRPKTGGLPGDVFYFAFDIKGLTQDEHGKVSYTLLMEVLDGKGGKIFQLGPRNGVAQNYLGGNLIPCSANLEIPPGTPPGAYDLRVTVEDRTTTQKTVFQSQGKILPAGFGLIRVGTFADNAGKVSASPVGVIGESLYIGFSVTGFERDKQSKRPDLHFALRLLDDKGQPTTPEPISGSVSQGVPEDLSILPVHFGFTLNRTGRFTLELQATDKLSGKSSQVSFPLQVTDTP